MKQEGFTIMEMVIGMAIIVIIAGFILAFITNPVERGKVKKLNIHIAQVEALIDQDTLFEVGSDEIAERIAKADFSFAEKVIGSFPLLLSMRTKETSTADFCSDGAGSGKRSAEGAAYRYIKKVNNNSSAGIYISVAPGVMNVPTNSDKTLLCKSGPNNTFFGIAVKVDDGLWACTGFTGSGASETRYFIADESGTGKEFKNHCFFLNGQFIGGNTNDFFTAEAEIYNE